MGKNDKVQAVYLVRDNLLLPPVGALTLSTTPLYTAVDMQRALADNNQRWERRMYANYLLYGVNSQLRSIREAVTTATVVNREDMLKALLIPLYDPYVGAVKLYYDAIHEYLPDVAQSAVFKDLMTRLDTWAQFLRHVEEGVISNVLQEAEGLLRQLALTDYALQAASVQAIRANMRLGGQEKDSVTIYIAQRAKALRAIEFGTWAEIAIEIVREIKDSRDADHIEVVNKIEKIKTHGKHGDFVKKIYHKVYGAK